MTVLAPEIGNDAVPDRETLIERARALQPMLSEHAAETEKSGRISDKILAAIRGAGLLRMTAPHRVGGYQAPFRTVIEVVETLAQACGSTAWVTGYTNTAKWMASLWSAEAQSDLFSKGADFMIAGSGHKPSADVRRVDGGYRFSGRWVSLSGVPYADWVGIWLKLPDENGQAGKVVEAIVPASDLEIVNTWNVAGMKGTGSESVVAADVYVPEHRTLDVEAFKANDWRTYPTPFKDEALYRAATHPVLALAVCAAPVGSAGAALAQAIAAGTKPMVGTRHAEAGQSAAYQHQVAEAAMNVETARLFLYRVADDIDAWAEKGEVMPPLSRARARYDCGWSVTHACRAIDMLMTAVGPGAFSDANPLQRYWRDANTASRHGAVNVMLGRDLYGKAILGIEDRDNILNA